MDIGSLAALTNAAASDSTPPAHSTQHRGGGGSGGGGGGGHQQQQVGQAHKRVYQACIPCRRRKVRCDLGSVDNPHDPPCVRCRRESKDCYFSATRRKRRADELDHDGDEGSLADHHYNDHDGGGDGPIEDDDYVARNGRKRLHAGEASRSPPPSHRETYRDVPLTPGGSLGRHEPLRRPGQHGRHDSAGSARRPSGRNRDSYGGDGDPNSPLENFEARSVMRREVYGPHDALDLLYKAATDNKHGMGAIGPEPTTNRPLSTSTPRIMLNSKSAGFAYGNGVGSGRSGEAPIDPQLGKSETATATGTPTGMSIALKAWSRFRFVRAGWFTAQEAIEYIDYYFQYLSPLTPISPPTYRDPASHPTLLSEEPVLAVTLLTIASRYRKLPGQGGKSRSYAIHEQLWNYLRGMIERVIWGQEAFGGGASSHGGAADQTSSTEPERGIRKGSLRTLGTIASLMILTEWHPRALHFPPAETLDELMLPSYDTLRAEEGDQDEEQQPAVGINGRRIESWLEPAWRSDRMCWMLLTTAMGLGYELGVFDNVEELLATGAITRPEYEDEQYRMRAYRTKRLILIYLSQLAGRLGWTNMVPERLRKEAAAPRRRPASVEGTTPGTTFSFASQPFNYIPDLELDDQIIHCWAGISNAMHTGNEKLFRSRKHTTEIIQSGKYIGLLKDLQPMLGDWWKEFQHFKLPPYIHHILTIEYEYVRIYINSLSLQAVVDRSAMVASNGVGVNGPAAPDGSSTATGEWNGLSPKTQDAYGKLPLGQLGGFGPADQEYVREVVDGSRNLLRTVVEGLLPGGYLKHAPVRTYFRIISGAMFLLKTFALGATKSDVELSIGLMDRTVDALRSCVVDDVHLGIRFADLLDNLTSRLRNRFIHAGGPGYAASGNGVSTGSKSPMLEQQQQAQGARHEGAFVSNERGNGNPAVNGSDNFARARDMLGVGRERSATPANVSATPFDLPFPNLNSQTLGLGGSALGGIGNGNSAIGSYGADLNNGAAGGSATDIFGADNTDWATGEMWYLPAGPAFFQSMTGETGATMGLSAEGVSVGGMDLLDYMAMDNFPMGGAGATGGQ